MKCKICGKKMKRPRVVQCNIALPSGERARDIVADVCPECRDDYGIVFDALQAEIDALEGMENWPLLSA